MSRASSGCGTPRRLEGVHRHPDALGDCSTDASRLWAWDGVSWHSLDTPGPELCRHIRLAYDTARGRLALYGGYDDAEREIYSERHHLGRDLREAFRAALAVRDFVSVRVGTGHARSSHWPMCGRTETHYRPDIQRTGRAPRAITALERWRQTNRVQDAFEFGAAAKCFEEGVRPHPDHLRNVQLAASPQVIERFG